MATRREGAAKVKSVLESEDAREQRLARKGEVEGLVVWSKGGRRRRARGGGRRSRRRWSEGGRAGTGRRARVGMRPPRGRGGVGREARRSGACGIGAALRVWGGGGTGRSRAALTVRAESGGQRVEVEPGGERKGIS